MNPWVVILLVAAVIVFGLDYLVRRKKWSDNTKEEKISLIVNMFSVGPYAFLSALGALWGIVAGGNETAFGKVLNDVTLFMGSTYFIVALAAVIVSFVLRKKGRAKESIWVNAIAFGYITAVLMINSLAGKIF